MRAPEVRVVAVTQKTTILCMTKPNGRIVRVDACVLTHACPHCFSRKGEPCWGPHGYTGGTRYKRRYLASGRLPSEPAPLSRARIGREGA